MTRTQRWIRQSLALNFIYSLVGETGQAAYHSLMWWELWQGVQAAGEHGEDHHTQLTRIKEQPSQTLKKEEESTCKSRHPDSSEISWTKLFLCKSIEMEGVETTRSFAGLAFRGSIMGFWGLVKNTLVFVLRAVGSIFLGKTLFHKFRKLYQLHVLSCSLKALSALFKAAFALSSSCLLHF